MIREGGYLLGQIVVLQLTSESFKVLGFRGGGFLVFFPFVFWAIQTY